MFNTIIIQIHSQFILTSYFLLLIRTQEEIYPKVWSKKLWVCQIVSNFGNHEFKDRLLTFADSLAKYICA